ncbi:MAG: hypothetical protein ABEJ27_00520 [Halodesulfurarchaeum sp.]
MTRRTARGAWWGRLAGHDVPVTRWTGTGTASPYSDRVTIAGQVTYQLDAREVFGDEFASIVGALDHDSVAFGCMDEWVRGLAETRVYRRDYIALLGG